MMSGGNSYFRSDFGIASKWFFNWVGSENIVSMQPEGSTNACPNCKDSGTFTVKAFDQWDSQPQKMIYLVYTFQYLPNMMKTGRMTWSILIGFLTEQVLMGK